MNNSAKVEAYKSFYQTAKDMYSQGDVMGARDAFLRAAELADNISQTATTNDVKLEYHKNAAKILNFVRANCSGKKPVKMTQKPNSGNGNNEKKDDDTPEFQPVEPDENKITFKDVAGLEDVKEQIKFKVLAPMNNPELAEAYNIKPGAKIMLYGPPGTGKTFIARAIAGEVDAKFYAINCQDLISKYMGDSSKQLDALFNTALKNERAIIFFDEFDSVASKRSDSTGGVDAEMSRFVATFLTKVDGFKKSKTNKMLLLISATNRPWAIDSAMVRGGRFDTQIYVGLPDEKAREFMVNKSLKKLPKDDDVDLKEFAHSLDGFGGGDITAICEKVKLEAYKRAIKSSKIENITKADLAHAIECTRNVITEEELAKFTAYRNGETVGE
ncbi:MAG: ATP-binding protein [Acidaminococcus sp.]|nr:ATP-binding protein [Acidaminococcus sp.]MDY4559894.1 ATP-binding protein [Eubacteriales bacterium]